MSPAAQIAVIDSFDPLQYIGTWYEIARLNQSFERGFEKITATYSLKDDGGIKVLDHFNIIWHAHAGRE